MMPVKYWRTAARDALKTARSLTQLKRGHHALFFYHLAVEKILKGLMSSRTGSVPPPSHNLLQLAQQAGLSLEESVESQLREIHSFNIAARHDDQKFSFCRKARGKYLKEWAADLNGVTEFPIDTISLIFVYWNGSFFIK